MNRTLPIAAATLLAAAAVVAAPAVANAAPVMRPYATTAPAIAWVTSADIATWSGTGAFPAGTWFTEPGTTTPTFGPSGATITTPGLLLHATTGAAATVLPTITTTDPAGTTLGTADVIQQGDAAFVLSLDLDGTTGTTASTSLIATAPGEAGIDGTYTADATIGTFTAGTPHTLAQYAAELTTADPAATVDAYGIVDQTGSTTVTGIAYQGANSYFTPKPVAAATPASISQTGLRTTGITVASTGFLPGETVQPTVLLADLEAVPATTTLTADASGRVAGTVTVAATVPAGKVAVVLEGTSSGVFVAFPITVTADPVATAPATPTAPVATPVSTRATFTG